MNGELIEDYKNDKPIHAVIAFDEKQNKVHIITAYEPTLDIFESDYKTRK